MDTIISTTWPPSYNLRISRKARHAHLKMIPHLGLEVVIPARLQKYINVADLLNEKKSWIEKHLATLEIPVVEAIDSLNLQAINQTWRIEYHPTLAKNISSIVRPGTHEHVLVLYGNVKDHALTHKWLQGWLKEIASEHLVAWLYALSVEHNLPYNKAAIRAQQTLWGSCTSRKNISLNYKLLFLPRVQTEHILLHELCHTKYLNHSKRFWNLLNKLDPNSVSNDRAVREGDKFVPACLQVI